MAAVRAPAACAAPGRGRALRRSRGFRCRCATASASAWLRAPRPRRRSRRGRPCCRAAPAAPRAVRPCSPGRCSPCRPRARGCVLRTCVASSSSSLSRPTIARAASMAAGWRNGRVCRRRSPRRGRAAGPSDRSSRRSPRGRVLATPSRATSSAGSSIGSVCARSVEALERGVGPVVRQQRVDALELLLGGRRDRRLRGAARPLQRVRRALSEAGDRADRGGRRRARDDSGRGPTPSSTSRFAGAISPWRDIIEYRLGSRGNFAGDAAFGPAARVAAAGGGNVFDLEHRRRR